MNRFSIKLTVCLCALAMAFGLLAGCSTGTSNLTSEQQANRTYMSQANGIMDSLGDKLDSFVDAVSRGDLVNMKTQAENAYKALDDLAALEAPEELADVQKGYVDGCAKLREALDQYIELYTQLNAGSFDQSQYSTRIAQIQSLYDEGVDLLKKADETAAGK